MRWPSIRRDGVVTGRGDVHHSHRYMYVLVVCGGVPHALDELRRCHSARWGDCHVEALWDRKPAALHRAGDFRVEADRHVASVRCRVRVPGMGTSPYAVYQSKTDAFTSGQKKAPTVDTTSNATEAMTSLLRMANYDEPDIGGAPDQRRRKRSRSFWVVLPPQSGRCRVSLSAASSRRARRRPEPRAPSRRGTAHASATAQTAIRPGRPRSITRRRRWSDRAAGRGPTIGVAPSNTTPRSMSPAR